MLCISMSDLEVDTGYEATKVLIVFSTSIIGIRLFPTGERTGAKTSFGR